MQGGEIEVQQGRALLGTEAPRMRLQGLGSWPAVVAVACARQGNEAAPTAELALQFADDARQISVKTHVGIDLLTAQLARLPLGGYVEAVGEG